MLMASRMMLNLLGVNSMAYAARGKFGGFAAINFKESSEDTLCTELEKVGAI